LFLALKRYIVGGVAFSGMIGMDGRPEHLRNEGWSMDSVLDIEQPALLVQYLRANGLIGADELIVARTLSGGVSNRTVLVERPDGDAWVIKQALAKLRVAADWFSSPERIHREAAGLQWLERLAPAGTTTQLVFEDHRHHILAMEAVPQPHTNWKSDLLAGRVERDQIEQFGALIGTIHRNASLRRAEVQPAFADQQFFESLRIEPYYRYTAGQLPESADFYQELIAATRARRLTLVHGDYSPKNILVHQGQLVLLDHEVIHFGDPAFDLGFSLTHLLSKAHYVVRWRDLFADAASHYWAAYTAEIDRCDWRADLERYVCMHTLGCLLARVCGRSPLEYLDQQQRQRQRVATLQLLQRPPTMVPALVDRFLQLVTACEAQGGSNGDHNPTDRARNS
jgi:aminoglycoside phosphotransferase (APT) family kinase protein